MIGPEQNVVQEVLEVSKPKEFQGKEKTRYSDEELLEFKKLILIKLGKTKETLRDATQTIKGNQNGTSDTYMSPKEHEEGGGSLSKEDAIRVKNRALKFIADLKYALIRIGNKTYGIDSKTGKLIPKERLRASLVARNDIHIKLEEKISKRYRIFRS